MTRWEPGIPLYSDPDVRYDGGERDIQYAREMFEYVNDLEFVNNDPDGMWAFDSRAYRWWAGQTQHTWSWQAPIAKRRVKSVRRR
jgi:hypothetical protein